MTPRDGRWSDTAGQAVGTPFPGAASHRGTAQRCRGPGQALPLERGGAQRLAEKGARHLRQKKNSPTHPMKLPTQISLPFHPAHQSPGVLGKFWRKMPISLSLCEASHEKKSPPPNHSLSDLIPNQTLTDYNPNPHPIHPILNPLGMPPFQNTSPRNPPHLGSCNVPFFGHSTFWKEQPITNTPGEGGGSIRTRQKPEPGTAPRGTAHTPPAGAGGR